MTLAVHLVLLLGVALVAVLAVRFPRRLFTDAADQAPPRRLEWGLAAGLAVFGLAIFEGFAGLTPSGRFALAVCGVILAAVVYTDLTYLIIPDLYSLVLGIAAFTAPWRLAPVEALGGAAICGGLLLLLALAWRRLMAVEGLGFGDVKLATAVGALLGPQAGLITISVSAALAALLIYGLRLVKRKAVAPLIPYGAALSIAAGGFLVVGVL